MTGHPLLAVRDLHASYGQVRVLNGVCLEVMDGDIRVILGANGAGKSTLLKVILGLVPARSGSVTFRGRELRGLRADQIHRLGIAWAPQGRQTFSALTVQENLVMGCYTERRRRVRTERLEEAYELFPVLRGRRRQLAGSLSGGEQQTLSVARALVSKPTLLIMDEPSVGLSPQAVESVFSVIGTIRQLGVSVMVVEQNARSALAIATWACVLDGGRVVADAAPDALMGDETIRAAYLG